MIVILSPAKSLDFSPAGTSEYSMPRLPDYTEELVRLLRKKSAAELQQVMKMSSQLAELTEERFRAFQIPSTETHAKQALLTFDGDAYAGLDAGSLGLPDLAFAQNHVRILSGLYGFLRPLDLIQAYRLEMGSRIKTRRGTNLYQYWGDRITNILLEDLHTSSSAAVLNLASSEYWKSINEKKLDVPVFTAKFLENKGGEYRFISYHGKRARGMMTRFIVQNRISNPMDIRAFDAGGYLYHEEMSDEDTFVFTRG